jgi:hypothetical protein
LKIDSVNQKFNCLECGNFSQDAGTPGNERVIAFSQLAVKVLSGDSKVAFAFAFAFVFAFVYKRVCLKNN